jgi:hypothetical protein
MRHPTADKRILAESNQQESVVRLDQFLRPRHCFFRGEERN